MGVDPQVALAIAGMGGDDMIAPSPSLISPLPPLRPPLNHEQTRQVSPLSLFLSSYSISLVINECMLGTSFVGSINSSWMVKRSFSSSINRPS